VTDRWLLAELSQAVARASKSFGICDYHGALEAAERFFWHDLCDNYIEIAKKRLYGDEGYDDAERRGAQRALYQALLASLKMFAPVMPHITEEIHSLFFSEREGVESIHVSAWPEPDGSWDDPGTLELLENSGFAFCNIDQPLTGDSLPPSAHITDPDTGYIRLHGRNRKDWFRSGAGRDARYDYLYSPGEMEEWSTRAGGMIGRVGSLFIITNNHFRGQALANALHLKSILEGGAVEAPASLIRSFESLREFAYPPPGEEELGFLEN